MSTIQLVIRTNGNLELDLETSTKALPAVPAVTGWNSAKTYGGSPVPGWSYGRSVAVHTNGDYWVAGNFWNGKLKFGNVATLTASAVDVFVAKFSASHSPLLALPFTCVGSSDFADVTGVAVDSAGNAWIHGYYMGTLTVGATTLPTTSVNTAFWVKLSPAGAVLVVQASVNNAHVATRRIAIDSSDNVYLVGSYTGTCSFGSISLPTESQNEVYVVKLNSSGVAQASQVSSGNATHYSIANGIAVASNGDIYIAGRFNNITNFGGTNLTSSVYGSAFVAKLNSSLSWTGAVATYYTGGTNPNSEAYDVELDGSGNVYISGRFQTAGGSMNLGSFSLSIPSGFDIFVAKLSTSLVFGAVNQGFCSDGKATALARDASGNVWSAGYIQGPTCNLSGTALNAPQVSFYLAKLNSSCVFSSVTSAAGSSGASSTSDIAIGSNGNIAWTGFVNGSASFGSNNVSSSNDALVVSSYTI